MAKKTARILRTLPIEGTIYKANDLVTLDDKLLTTLDRTAYDTSKAALGYCKSIGIAAVEHASTAETESLQEGGQAEGSEGGQGEGESGQAEGSEGGQGEGESGQTEGSQGEGEGELAE
ncbi:MAG: hypothetical protein M0Q49_01660 [Porticoccaceae bacterium]|nr:hypothetical protein [Porticoccaceae bacterium]